MPRRTRITEEDLSNILADGIVFSSDEDAPPKPPRKTRKSSGPDDSVQEKGEATTQSLKEIEAKNEVISDDSMPQTTVKPDEVEQKSMTTTVEPEAAPEAEEEPKEEPKPKKSAKRKPRRRVRKYYIVEESDDESEEEAPPEPEPEPEPYLPVNPFLDAMSNRRTSRMMPARAPPRRQPRPRPSLYERPVAAPPQQEAGGGSSAMSSLMMALR
jgi:hypothetical protein